MWSELGFSRKDTAKSVLLKNFTEKEDFIIRKAAPEYSGAGSYEKNLGGAGKNKENILMNLNNCMISGTKSKGD